jgi:choline dehydrogenase-like flavoprotein
MRTVIVGSGAGGSAVFRSLSERREVAVVEGGPPLKDCGVTGLPGKYYEIIDAGSLEIWQTLCDGGSTAVSLGNGVRSLEEECRARGVDISVELDLLEKELGVADTPMEALGETGRRLFRVMEDSGHDPRPMPKFIDFSRCTGCGRCAFGCLSGARWDARTHLKGARVVNGFRVTRVLGRRGQVMGVEGVMDGRKKVIEADEVVLSAGALHTPAILQASGIEAGKTLFVDPFVTVGGILEDACQDREVPMGFYAEFDGFILSPHYSIFLQRKLKEDPRDIAGVMVKIKDDNEGSVEGTEVTKTFTERDRERLERGIEVAREVLEEMGVRDIAVTHVRGVHQGGTFPLTSRDLDTEVEGLYVADASLLPEAPGKPPMLAVMALARKVAKRMLEV